MYGVYSKITSQQKVKSNLTKIHRRGIMKSSAKNIVSLIICAITLVSPMSTTSKVYRPNNQTNQVISQEINYKDNIITTSGVPNPGNF